MSEMTYGDQLWGNPISISELTEQDIEDIKRMIDEINNEGVNNEQKTGKHSENLED